MSEIERLKALLESQAKALSEAEARADTWPQWAESIWAKLQEYGYQADDDCTVDLAEVFDEWADGFEAACTARALAAEARLAEAMKVIEPFAKYEVCSISKMTQTGFALFANSGVKNQPAFKHFDTARAFTNAAKTQESKDA